VPPYFEERLDKAGAGEYRATADDQFPMKFQLPEEETAAVWALVGKLDYFRHPLESPAKVAFMGTKLLRYESGGARSETRFNFTEDAAARALVEYFDRMAESAEIHIDLERAAKYDHLGVMKALNELAAAMEDRRVAAAGQFLPLLDRIAANENFMHTARALAADMADAIRKPRK
jgi:hypothetical protein